MGRKSAWVAMAALALALGACGGSDDDGDGAGGGGTSSGGGLAGLLKGFGAGNSTGNGNTGTGNTGSDAGVDSPGNGSGNGSGATDCESLCERVLGCVSEGGCPNFGRLPAAQQTQAQTECVASCRGGLDEQTASQAASMTCAQIYQEIAGADPDVQAFCALEPATEAECTDFCALIRGCGATVDEVTCQVTCFYGEGVRCVLEAGVCAGFEQCRALFPSSEG